MEKICMAILFGSKAQGISHEKSDTDIAIETDGILTLEEKFSAIKEIAGKLKTSEDDIDLIDLRLAPPLLQHEIAEKGRLIIGKEDDFIRFKVLAWKRYLDTAKFRRAREEALQDYINV